MGFAWPIVLVSTLFYRVYPTYSERVPTRTSPVRAGPCPRTPSIARSTDSDFARTRLEWAVRFYGLPIQAEPVCGTAWACALFFSGRHFTEIPSFGRPACHLANVLAPKVGCALKCTTWAGDPTPKQHPKASSGLWAMGLEMAMNGKFRCR